jgi:hypothetical protein
MLANALPQRIIFRPGDDGFGEVVNIGKLGRKSVGLTVQHRAQNFLSDSGAKRKVDADLHPRPAILRSGGDEMGDCGCVRRQSSPMLGKLAELAELEEMPAARRWPSSGHNQPKRRIVSRTNQSTER